MDVDIIVTCERCGKRFLLNKPVNYSLGKDFNAEYTGKEFDPEKGPLILRRYVQSLHQSEYYVELDKTKVKGFCKDCDDAYWKNFDNAVEVLRAFWHKTQE